MLAAFMGAALRVFGGWISDRWGGINTLSVVLSTVAVTLTLCGLAGGSLVATTLLVMACFAALGAVNGALLQLVTLSWPLATAAAGSMIGEVGALGGGLVPSAMGLSRQYAGCYVWGFVFFASLALAMLRLRFSVRANFSPKSKNRTVAPLGRAARTRALWHLLHAGRRGLVVLAGRLVHRAD